MSPRPVRPGWLLLGLLLIGGGAQAQSTLPAGGHVVAGSASVGAPNGNTLSITQTSPKAIVNWNSFSVGQPNTVDFNQPSSSAAILNRVTGSTPSTIAGQIDANGQVYLVNPNGVAITPSGSVQVGGGFVASTLAISNQGFMGGNLSFAGNGASAPVSNAGSITAGPGGYVGLIGGTAANSGVISVPLGKVALGSGEAATLDVNGGGFLQVAVPTGATTAKGQALVSNSGKVSAAGGTVELRAATVATAIRDAVNMSGTIAATSVSGHDGAITLSGGPGGAVNVSGTLDASGGPSYSSAAANGGSIRVSGARVRVGHHAVLNASGAKGGSVLVGVTGLGGQGEAAKTTIASGATIVATGLPGQGGTIETSGKILNLGKATINTGSGGTWLLDPDSDILITGSGGESVTCTTGTCTPTGDSSIVYASTIESALDSGTSVTVTTSNPSGAQAGNITVGQTAGGNDGAILLTSAQTVTLDLEAGAGGGAGSITINSPISDAGSGGALSLVLNAPNGGVSVANAITLAGGLTANAGAGSIAVSAPIQITAGGAVSLDYAGSLSFTPALGSLQFTGGSASGATLTINGAEYTLLYDLSTDAAGLQSIDTTNDAGDYALAIPLTATGSYAAPLAGQAAAFTGNFNGLGNTISNLTINDPNDGNVGLFGQVGQNGTISNIGLVGGSVTGAASAASVAALVGTNSGAIAYAYATGTVAGGSGSTIDGGLVGTNASTGTIANSYATGAVSGGTNNVGGLVGQNIEGAISLSYAAGSVTGGSGASIGGLLGYNFLGTIANAYATGSAAGGSGANVGGLVGINFYGSITNAYATGAVSGSGATLGGLIGTNNGTGVFNGYYDATTTGMPLNTQSDGSIGVTTTDLASATTVAALNSGGTVWANVGNQTTPYLIGNPGTVYLATDSTTTPTAYTLIFNATQLQSINNNLTGDFALAQNLDLTGVTWTPIGGNSLPAFTGNFNGLGNTVANLTTLDLTDPTVGLFGTIGSTGAVSNLVLSGGGVTAPNDVGALAGVNSGTISNVTSSVPVTGFYQVGGLVGDQLGGSITNSSASGAVVGEIVPGSSSSGSPGPIGGLLGELDAGSVSGSSASGAVTAADGTYIGGLIGLTALSTTVSGSFATGNVTATQLTTGGNNVGGLIGFNDATVTNSYATGTVTGGGSDVGGLIGNNDVSSGGVSLSFATGAVTGGSDVGGLIGYDNAMVATNNVYATGAVSGGGNVGGLIGELNNTLNEAYASGAVSGSVAGGLVGQLDASGAITDAYATGAVSGGTGSTLGGLVGQNGGGSILDGYYDADTTGMPYDGVVGLHTAQLQSFEFADATYFQNNTSWGIISGISYPYLAALNPSTPQVVSGIAYQDAGVTPLASPFGIVAGTIPPPSTVSALVAGTNVGTVTTGANGYYYFLLPARTIPSGGSAGGVLTYATGAGAFGGAAFADGISGGVATGVAIFGNTLHEITADTENSVLQANLANAAGTDPTAVPLLTGLPNLQIDASGSFDLDTSLSYSGTVTLNAGGVVTESAGTITATTLAGSSVNGAVLDQVNTLTNFGPWTDTGSTSVGINLVNSQSLATSGALSSQTGGVALEALTGDITINNPVSGYSFSALPDSGTIYLDCATGMGGACAATPVVSTNGGGSTFSGPVVLEADSTVSEASSGAITFTSMVDAATAGGAALTVNGGLPVVFEADIGTNNPLSSLTITNTPLGETQLFGNVTTAGGGQTYSTALIAETSMTLSDTAGGGITFNGTLDGYSGAENVIVSTTGAVQFNAVVGSLTPPDSLSATGGSITISGAIATNSAISLTSTGSTGGTGNSLVVPYALTAPGGTVTLNSAGTVEQTGGYVSTTTLTGSSVGGATLTQTNYVSTFGPWSDTDPGTGTTGIAFVNGQALQTVGAIGSTGDVSLNVNGGGLTIGTNSGDTVSGNNVTLIAAGGTISEAGGAAVLATNLTATTQIDGGAGITLDQSGNTVTGNVTLTALDSTGTTLQPAIITFNDSGSSTGFTIAAGNAYQPGIATDQTGTVSLTSGGPILETGIVSTGSLIGSSAGGATLTGANLVSSGVGFTNTGSGDVSFTNAETLAVAGVSNTVGNITLTTTSGDISLVPTTAITASPTGTVTLASAGGIGGSASNPSQYPTISAGALSVTAVDPVDLPGANTVDILAAKVTGAVASFDLANAQSLTVYTVGSLRGVTTNDGNIVLDVKGGDLDIEEPVSTNGRHGRTLMAGLTGQIGLRATGSILQDQFGGTGYLVAAAVEAIAGVSIDLDPTTSPYFTGLGNRIGATDVGGVAQTSGVFSGRVNDAGGALSFSDTDAPLTIDKISDGPGEGVTAGSLSLNAVSGVVANDGDISIAAFSSVSPVGSPLTLDAQVNADKFVSGAPSTVLQNNVGTVSLLADGGDLTQSASGVIYASQLLAEAEGSVLLTTANNRIGERDNGSGIAQTAGLVAGFAESDFELVDHDASLSVRVLDCGCRGIFTALGDIDLATTGAGNILVNRPLNAGQNINIAVAPGYSFTNSAVNDPTFDSEYSIAFTAGLDTSTAKGTITILADQISLANGTMRTHRVGGSGGTVVLAPATPTDGIVLGGAGSSGVLGLQTADFATIKAGGVQIGYRNPDGSASLSSNIDIAGNLSIDTDDVPLLTLVTGGSVAEAGGTIIATGASTLQLGIVASGTNSLDGANGIGRLAAYIDGTNPNLSFNNAEDLTVGKLSLSQIGVTVDGNTGLPTPSVISGPESNPLSGITTSGGAATTGGVTLTTSAGGITVRQPIATGAQPVNLSAVGAIAFDNTVNTTGMFSATAGSGGGSAVAMTQNADGLLTLGGSASFTNDGTGGTISLTDANPISGTASLSTTGSGADASLTSTAAFTLTSATIGGNLTVTDTAGLTIGGSVSSPGTISLTGPLILATAANVAAPTIDISGASTLALDGNAALGQSGATIDLANTAGSGAVTEAPTATIIASSLGATDGLTGNASLIGTGNAIQALSAIGVTGSGNGFSLVTNSPLSVNGALTATSGPVSLVANAGNLTIASGAPITGDGVVLSTSADFINSAGGGAVTTTGGGVWLLYSAAPGGDMFGGLDSGNTAIWGATYTSLPPASVTQSGNRYLFAQGQTVTVTTVSDNKIYGTDATTQVAADYTVSGFASGVTNAFLGDTAATSYTGAPAVTSIGSAVTASVAGGPYSIVATTGSLTALDGYSIAFVNTGTLAITPAPLTASIVGAPTKTYDGTTTASLASANFSLSGFITGQGASVSALTGAYNTPDVATATTVTASLTLSEFTANAGTNLGNYTLPTAASGAGAITPGTLTASIVGAPTKTYDGTTTASLASSNFSLSGFVAGQGASVSALTGAYNSADVATATTITASLTPSEFTANAGTNLGNYTLPATASGAGAITPASLTASIVGAPTKVYDGTATASLASSNFSLSGFVAGQGASVSALTGAYNSPDVATATTITASLTPSEFTANAGTNFNNYTLPATASGAGSITPASLTAGLTGTVSKVYDGTTAASLAAGNYALSGVVGGDNVSLNDPTNGSYASANVGASLNVSVSGLALTGSAAGNYTLASTTANADIGVIAPASLTASIVGTPTKTYDGAATASLAPSNFSLSGFVAGQGATVSALMGAYNSPDVATATTVTASLTPSEFTANAGTSLSNYTLPATASGAGSITPATLTASIVGTPTKTYDGTATASLAPSNFSLSGFVAGQGASVSALTGAYNTPDVATATTITASLTSSEFTANVGTTLGNYTLPTTASGAGSITPATLTASIVGTPTKTYDGTTTAPLLGSGNFSLSGFVAGQGVIVLAPLRGTYNSANVASATTVTASLVPADFIATGGTLLSNYTPPTTASGAGSITPAPLIASIFGKPTKTYDGTATAPLSSENFELFGFVAGQGATVSALDGTYASANAGSGISVTAILAAGDFTADARTSLSNYTLPTSASGAGTITPASLAASIVGTPTKTYDGTTTASLASANFSLSGFIAGQGASVSALTGAYSTPDVATATTITASLTAGEFTANAGTNLGNYTLPTTASGAGSITPATLMTSIVGAPAKTYDGTTTASLTSANFSLSGFVAGQGASLSVLTGSYNTPDVATATTVTASLTASEFTANAGTNLGNYTLPATASGAGSITPATLTITAADATKSYGTALTFSPTAFAENGLVAGDTIAGVVLSSSGAAASVSVAGSPYAITAGGATGTGLSNYAITYIPGALTVTPAPLTVAADDLRRLVGQQNPPLGYTITSGDLFNGDALSGTLATLATGASPIGTYAITQGTLAANPNYALAFIDGTLTIAAISNRGVSPSLFILSFTGKGGSGGDFTAGLTTCPSGAVAALLKGAGKAVVYGGAGGGCGGS